MQIRLRDPLAYPAGCAPGFDPGHLAARGCSFSGIAVGTSAINFLTAKASTGALVTAPTAAIDGIVGPCNVFPGTAANGLQFPGCQPAVADSTVTIAAILRPTSLGSLQSVLTTADTSGGGYTLIMTSTLIVSINGLTSVDSLLPISAGVPYFMAASIVTAKAYNFVTTNLLTGLTRTATIANATAGNASTGNYIFGGYNFSGDVDCHSRLSCAMVARGNIPQLSLAQLTQWAADPWSFWYPTANDDIFAEIVGTAPLPTSSMVFTYNTDVSVQTLAVNVQATAILNLGS